MLLKAVKVTCNLRVTPLCWPTLKLQPEKIERKKIIWSENAGKRKSEFGKDRERFFFVLSKAPLQNCAV